MNAHLGGRGLKVRFFLSKQPWKLKIVLTSPSYTLIRAYRTKSDPFLPSTRSTSAQQAASLRDDRTTHFDFDDPFSTHLNAFTTIFPPFATSYAYVLLSGSLVLFCEEKRHCIHPPRPAFHRSPTSHVLPENRQTNASKSYRHSTLKECEERRTQSDAPRKSKKREGGA